MRKVRFGRVVKVKMCCDVTRFGKDDDCANDVIIFHRE